MTTTALRGKKTKKKDVVEGLFPMLDFVGECSNLYGNLI